MVIPHPLLCVSGAAGDGVPGRNRTSRFPDGARVAPVPRGRHAPHASGHAVAVVREWSVMTAAMWAMMRHLR